MSAEACGMAEDRISIAGRTPARLDRREEGSYTPGRTRRRTRPDETMARRSRAMECPARPAIHVRAWGAWRSRGARYAWHKALRRSLARWPAMKRRLVYADPRDYWTLRGGD